MCLLDCIYQGHADRLSFAALPNVSQACIGRSCYADLETVMKVMLTACILLPALLHVPQSSLGSLLQNAHGFVAPLNETAVFFTLTFDWSRRHAGEKLFAGKNCSCQHCRIWSSILALTKVVVSAHLRLC